MHPYCTKTREAHSPKNKSEFLSLTAGWNYKKIYGQYTLFLPLYYSFCHYQGDAGISSLRFMISGLKTAFQQYFVGVSGKLVISLDGTLKTALLILPPYRSIPEKLLSSDYYGSYLAENEKHIAWISENGHSRISFLDGLKNIRRLALWYFEFVRLTHGIPKNQKRLLLAGLLDGFKQTSRFSSILAKSMNNGQVRTLDCASIYSFPAKIALIEKGASLKQMEYVNGLVYQDHFHYFFNELPDPALMPSDVLVDNLFWAAEFENSHYRVHRFTNHIRLNNLFEENGKIIIASIGINYDQLLAELIELKKLLLLPAVYFKPHPGYGYSEEATELLEKFSVRVRDESLYATKHKYNFLMSLGSSLLFESEFHGLPTFKIMNTRFLDNGPMKRIQSISIESAIQLSTSAQK